MANLASWTRHLTVVVAKHHWEGFCFRLERHRANAVQHDRGAAERAAEVEVENGAEAVLKPARCPEPSMVQWPELWTRGAISVGDERLALDKELDREDANIVESFEERVQVRFGLGLQKWIVEGRD